MLVTFCVSVAPVTMPETTGTGLGLPMAVPFSVKFTVPPVTRLDRRLGAWTVSLAVKVTDWPVAEEPGMLEVRTRDVLAATTGWTKLGVVVLVRKFDPDAGV